MPHKQLENLARIGKLKPEKPAQGEVDGLTRSGKARLRDADIGMDIDQELVGALIRVAQEVAKRLRALGPVP